MDNVFELIAASTLGYMRGDFRSSKCFWDIKSDGNCTLVLAFDKSDTVLTLTVPKDDNTEVCGDNETLSLRVRMTNLGKHIPDGYHIHLTFDSWAEETGRFTLVKTDFSL
jgi:hypothetical protein